MFSKNKKPQSKASAPTTVAVPAKPAAPSLISTDMKITGNLESKGEIQVDGAIRGDISTKKLLVGETADIQGEIIADSIRVHGRINGQIKAREVVLAKTAHVVGDILHENLSIEPGAFLEGLCKRISNSDLAAAENRKPIGGGSSNLSSEKPAPGAAPVASPQASSA